MRSWGAFGLIVVLIGCGPTRPPVINPTPPPPTTTTTTTPPVTVEPQPPGAKCENPTPGPIAKMEVKTHVIGPNWRTIDATPLVGQRDGEQCTRDFAYCASVGFTDGRGYCSPRGEGSEDRGSCDKYITGGGIVWSWQSADAPFGPPRLITCFDTRGAAYTCPTAPDGLQMHPEGWMLQVRPNLKGKAKACPKVLSGCPGLTDDTWNGCGVLVIQ